MSEGTYWTRRQPIGRRAMLRGAGVALSGLAGAALIGCGGDEDAPQAATTGQGAPAAAGSDKPVPADQVRLKAGQTYSGIFATPAEQNPLVNAKRGGTLKFAIFDSPHMDFNRVLSSTVNTPNDLTKNKLFRLKLGALADPAAIEIEPDLAQSFEVTPDAQQYTLHLRKGVKFHNVAPANGRELTSEDVRLSIQRYQSGGVQKDVFKEVTSVETPDAYTVVIKLSQPLGEFTRAVASWSYMDAKEMVADLDFLAEHAIGTGPFIQESWTKKEGQTFVKHPEYFEQGLPFVDRVEGNVISDPSAQQAAFITDNILDYGANNEETAQNVLRQAKDSVLFTYEGAQGANVNGFHFQMKNPKWQDVRVRRAFSMAFDREEWDLAARGPDSVGGWSTGPIAWRAVHDQLPTLESQGPYYQYDPAEATKLLNAAGYTNASPVTADMPAWYARNDWSQIMVPQLNALGPIRANFREVDNPTAVTMLNDRNFEDCINIVWGPPAYAVDQTLYPWYHSTGGLNHNNVNDPEMDRLVTAQRAEQDPKRQRELWLQNEQRIYDQVWDVFTPVAVKRRGMWHNYVLNFRQHGLGNLTVYCTAQLRSVWLDNV